MQGFQILSCPSFVVIILVESHIDAVITHRTIPAFICASARNSYNRLQAEVFDNLNTYRPDEIRNICADNKSADYKKVSGYLARIEHFCVGLNQGIYDKITFYALSHGYFDGHQIRKRIEPVIESKNSSKNSKEQFYDDTLSVLRWMEKKAVKK